MKIITITMHRAENYGAILQCYALQKALKNLGCESEVLDLGTERPFYLPLKGKIRHIPNKIKGNYIFWKQREIRKLRRDRFSDFLNANIDLTRRYNSMEDLCGDIPEADIYITGSDQVFNPDMNRSLVSFYRLEFVPTGKKKFSYAASLGNFEPEKDDSSFWDAMKTYDMISLREDRLNDLFRERNLKIRNDVDPVFLISKNEWHKLSSDVRKMYSLPERYIFVFELIPRTDMGEFIKLLKKQYEIPAVVLSIADKYEFAGERLILDSGPAEFLGLIENAEVVVTTSYHGAVLSLIFEKEIYALPSTSKNRFETIFEKLGLLKRVIYDELILDNDCIQYEDVNRKMEDFVESSKNYLREIINSVNQT